MNRFIGVLTLALALMAVPTNAQQFGPPGPRPGGPGFRPGPGGPGPGFPGGPAQLPANPGFRPGIGGPVAGPVPGIPGHGYVPVADPLMLIEHFVRHSDLLVTNINLTRASGFRVEQVWIDTWMQTPCWASNFYREVLAAVRRPNDPDVIGFQVGEIVYNFRMKVIELYDVAINAGPGPSLNRQFERVNFAYFNAISATYFYIEALRRGLVLPQPPPPMRNRALLMKRLALLEQNAATVQNLMYAIRYALPFQFPLGRNCIECSFVNVRVQVNAPGPVDVVFPYYANNKVIYPDQMVQRVEAPARYNPMYTEQVWNNAWNYIDQGYLNPNTVNRSYTPPQGVNVGGVGIGGTAPVQGVPAGGVMPNWGQQTQQGAPIQGGVQNGQGQGADFVRPYTPTNPNVGGQPIPGQNTGGQLPQQGGQQLPPQQGGQQQPPAQNNGTYQPSAYDY